MSVQDQQQFLRMHNTFFEKLREGQTDIDEDIHFYTYADLIDSAYLGGTLIPEMQEFDRLYQVYMFNNKPYYFRKHVGNFPTTFLERTINQIDPEEVEMIKMMVSSSVRPEHNIVDRLKFLMENGKLDYEYLYDYLSKIHTSAKKVYGVILEQVPNNLLGRYIRKMRRLYITDHGGVYQFENFLEKVIIDSDRPSLWEYADDIETNKWSLENIQKIIRDVEYNLSKSVYLTSEEVQQYQDKLYSAKLLERFLSTRNKDIIKYAQFWLEYKELSNELHHTDCALTSLEEVEERADGDYLRSLPNMVLDCFVKEDLQVLMLEPKQYLMDMASELNLPLPR